MYLGLDRDRVVGSVVGGLMVAAGAATFIGFLADATVGAGVNATIPIRYPRNPFALVFGCSSATERDFLITKGSAS